MKFLRDGVPLDAYAREIVRLYGRGVSPQAKTRDARAIPHHYDVSNEFYALVLDPLMVYTCAYYRDPNGTLEQAQAEYATARIASLGLDTRCRDVHEVKRRPRLPNDQVGVGAAC